MDMMSEVLYNKMQALFLFCLMQQRADCLRTEKNWLQDADMCTVFVLFFSRWNIIERKKQGMEASYRGLGCEW